MLFKVDEVILMGESNVDLLRNNEPEFKYFRNFLESMNFAQIVNEPESSSRIKGLLQEEAKLIIVEDMVFPVIFYALSVFGGRLSLGSTILKGRLQNSSVRVVYSLRKFDDVSQYCNAASILPGMLQTSTEIRDCRTWQDAMLKMSSQARDEEERIWILWPPGCTKASLTVLRWMDTPSSKTNLD
ncbi:hypothetical protein J6590_045640 [Homalodisca vitripennis]|nr:hypothetical protein J6590_045640 [Homalodisca vitripennis]